MKPLPYIHETVIVREEMCDHNGLSLIHISEPTRPLYISYAVFCLKKKTTRPLYISYAVFCPSLMASSAAFFF